MKRIDSGIAPLGYPVNYFPELNVEIEFEHHQKTNITAVLF